MDGPSAIEFKSMRTMNSSVRIGWWPFVCRAVALLAIAAAPLSRADVLSLDGNGDYVTFPGTGIPSGNAPFTIEAWINPTTIPTGGQDGGVMTFWGNQSAQQANGFRLRGSTGVRHFFWSNDHDENMTQDVLPDTSGVGNSGWHHFAITFDGFQTRWYWNGAPLGNPRNAPGVNVVAANHRIGARLNLEYFHGYMDEIRIWNVARSAAAIAENFQQELNGDEAGLVAYWSFEGNLVDRAGGNNNGTEVGNATVFGGINAPVLPLGPRIYSFTASTNQIYLGQSATLSWAVSNATSVVIDNGIGSVTPSNSIVVSPSATTTYTLTATNAIGTRAESVTVTVDPGIPTAFNLATNTPYNTPLAIALRGFDPQGSNLTFSIVTPPSHGNLSGTPPNVTYTPALNFGGLDTFTFKVNDGTFDSAPATVSIDVVPPPTPPSGVLLSSTNISPSAGPGDFIAALQAVDVNNPYGDSHTFALVSGAVDNAQFTLTGNLLSASPSFLGGLGATFTIRVAITDSTGLSSTQNVALAVVNIPRPVVLNEFHYNNPDNTVLEGFIELHNPSDAPVDISQWRVRGGVDFFFPANTSIPAGGYVVVAENPAMFASRYGFNPFGPWVGGLNNEGEEVTLRDALNDVIDRVDFSSEFPWPISPNGGGHSMHLVNATLDNDLGSSWRGALPTPGAVNSVWSSNAAPNIRQVNHTPKMPASTDTVLVTAKVTDPEGVASVTLAYQVVAPGNYIPARLPLTGGQLNSLNTNPSQTNAFNPAFEHPTNWITVAMNDNGVNGDVVAGDGIYSVRLPQQAHRALVRYRITCTDSLGLSRRAPFEDDPSLNFAYFVYNGVPNYLGHNAAALQTLEVYTLITRDVDINQCAAWYPPFNNATDQLPQDVGGQRNTGRLHFNWEGALVYDGEVFDHVRYRLRGANGRYHPGKRSFRIRFNDGKLLEPRDMTGQKMRTKWRELTTGKGQSNRGGEQFALNEVVNMFLWNKAGVPAPRTFHFHFRVIRGADESSQYGGDFWGLNWGQEKYDVNFLDAHDMPKGNLYKLVDNYVLGTDERRYQGPFAVTNAQDFFNIENNLTGFQSVDWLKAHANYTNWYRYYSVARAIRHYDTWPSANKNGAWYFEPPYAPSNSFYGRMMQLPYDSTDTWGATWNNGDDILYNGIFASGAPGGDAGSNPAMQIEYRNVAREMRTLLFQPDQMFAIIDAHAQPLLPVGAADFDRWRSAPSPASYSALNIPVNPGSTGGVAAYVQDMKNFMFVGGNYPWWASDPTYGTGVPAGGWISVYDNLHIDSAIPNRPTITYTGASNAPANGLTFQSSTFADPQGAGTFAGMQWRIAEVLPTNTVVTNVAQLRLEWDAAYLSPEFASFNSSFTFPEFAIQPGKLYRARVRHKDNTGRWSDWSLPALVTPTPTDTLSALRTNLVFNEIMYNPPPFGGIPGSELEFLELKNIGSFTLDLSGLFFSQGITFSFPVGTTLGAGQVFVLARNEATMPFRYPGLTIHGIYTGQLNNDGETLAIAHPIAGEIISLTYTDRSPWPVTANGHGYSIVRDASGAYRASAALYGNPGADGGATEAGGVVINELLSNSTLPLKDYIELVNLASTNVDISGWYMTDDPKLPQKFRIPTRAPLAPGEFAVFTEDDFNATPGSGTSFSLSSFGDELYLFSANASAQLTGYDYGISFGAAADGESFGRHINSVGEVLYPAQISRTPGAVNSSPRVGPVVISEIMYHPEPGADEFVELKNISGSPVSLFDPSIPTNTWKLSGVGFTFPTNITLDTDAWLLIVATNPADFRAKYGVPLAVQIVGPFAGNLQNSGERLQLQQAGPATTNGVPFITIDAVRYNDKFPWPEAADGAGPSLHRLNNNAFGNDPIEWTAAVATPGGWFTPGVPPIITSHPTNVTVGAGNTATFSVSASGSDLQYRWQRAGTNIPGATNATLVLNNVQLNQATNYTAFVFNSAGSAVSTAAKLTVLAPVTFTLEPESQNVAPGANLTLNAAAIGNGPVRYQWRFEGADIPGATNASYSITGANLSQHHGNFSVVAADDFGSTASSNALIYVMVGPGVVQHLTPQSVIQGGTVIFSVVATGAPPLGFRWVRSFGQLPPVFTDEPVLVWSNIQVTSQLRVVVTNRANTGGVQSPAGGNITISVLTDADQDGVADNWESAYFGTSSTNNPANALEDPDGDGMDNRSEYVAGTNPTNALSLLNIVVSATNVSQLNFVAQTNINYTVQWRTNLGSAPWQRLTNIVGSSQVRTMSVNTATAPGTSERYFRVVTPLVP